MPPSVVPFCVMWFRLECVMLQYFTALCDSVLMAAISIYEDEDDWTVSARCSPSVHTRVLQLQ